MENTSIYSMENKNTEEDVNQVISNTSPSGSETNDNVLVNERPLINGTRSIFEKKHHTIEKREDKKRRKKLKTMVQKKNEKVTAMSIEELEHPIASRMATITSSIISKLDGFSLPLAADATKLMEDGVIQNFESEMILKADHAVRPLVVCPTGHIYLEMMNEFSKQASDFLATIAEPVSRPEYIHEFQITVFSLYSAVGSGISVEEILNNLNKFSKNHIPEGLKNLLSLHAGSFGKVKLLLRDNCYFLEAQTRQDLEYMLTSSSIAEARMRNSMTIRQIQINGITDKNTAKIPNTIAASEVLGPDTIEVLNPRSLGISSNILSDINSQYAREEVIINAEEPKQVEVLSNPGKQCNSFLVKIKAEMLGKVKECALTELKRPLVFEYEFKRDQKNPSLNISLRPSTKIRYYQERALRKMFSNSRARSGIIVLPCGAGKTLTGITAISTIRKSAMILTTSSVAVEQWRRSLIEFTNVDTDLIVTLTSEKKQDLPEMKAACLISTYTMMSYSGKRSSTAERILSQIQEREWGILIFDEVQFAPAPAFRKINDNVKSHCKLGLTATLVREDDLIHDLQWLIGPKLYEANWLELQEAGYLAKVQVSEVWCPMTADFYREYLKSSHAKQRKLWVCNPNKLRVCEYLIKFHEARNDKIIVFSDNLFALKEVAITLNRPFISGEVGMQERMIILNNFREGLKLNTVFLSKVGDNAIDIPCANVVIQISFNFASRRQEAQRLGRILRPKPKLNEMFNAFFYSLVSKDTQEMLYADKRQQFIIDQGYAYKVLPITVFPMENEDLLFNEKKRHNEMLARIIATNDQYLDLEEDEVNLNDGSFDARRNCIQNNSEQPYVFTTLKSSLSKMSGASGGFISEKPLDKFTKPLKRRNINSFFK